MIGLLALTALPTTIAVAEGISSQKRAAATAANPRPPDEKLMRKFHLRCYCNAKSARRGEVHGGWVVVRGGKVYISRPQSSSNAHANANPEPHHLFEGFYITYPDDDRPPPLPIGLVTTISDTPPMLNWIYVDGRTGELRHGNRTQSRAHRVGSWGWVVDEDGDEGVWRDEDEEGGGGGLTLGGEERFVLVEPEEGEGGLWEVWWDERDDGLKGGRGVGRRRVLRCSLDREFVEGREEGKEGGGVGKGRNGGK